MRMLSRLMLIAALSSAMMPLSSSPAIHAAEKEESKGKSEKLTFANNQLTLETPDTWKSVPTKSNFIQHEFRAPAEGDSFARITFSISGGSVKQNIDRWVGQFETKSKDDVKTETKEIEKTETHLIDIVGTYKESTGGGPFAPGVIKKMENYRLLGAIIVLKDGTQVFVKATGPKEILTENKDAFDKMVQELKTN